MPAYIAKAENFKESMGARNREGKGLLYCTCPPGYIGLRNSFLGIDFWVP
jgi:hypothetical protein